jgi:hypothetical protein
VIRSSRPVKAGIDGEAVTLESPVRFETCPGALRVRLARQQVGVSPAAITRGVQRAGVRGIWKVALGHAPDAAGSDR